MRKLYTTKKQAFNSTPQLVLFALLVLICAFNGYSQVTVPFAPRTSTVTPLKTVYTVKGDFSMIGNTNLTLASYGDNTINSNDMIYVDVDNDANTLNSSSATLNFSTENGAIPSCSNIIYAGLYWTGRAGTSEVFNVNNIELNKRKVLLKKESTGTYSTVTANTTSLVNKNIYYPSGIEGNMYSAYAEITDYVKANGLGEYFVANVATLEGSPDGTGYYGGWGMVVVYENSLMKWRDITVFDGHAYVQGSTTVNYTFDVNGFNTAQNGDINLKLGVMAGEGDVGISGDYFQIQRQDNGSFQPLSHSSNSTTNFFNSSINTGGNARNPNLINNTGLDISMFNINNTNNGVITNNQTQTRFRYGSTQDTYIIFNVTFSVDSYVPEINGVITNTSINGNPNPVPIIIEPGQFADYKLEIKNAGTEATNNTVVTIPLPDTVDPVDLNIIFNTNFTPLSSGYSDPQYIPSSGTNGSIVWNLGTLPLPVDPDTVLADISFKLTATTNCSIIGDITNPPTISLFGSISGIGAISNVSFNTPLIQGYSVDDICKDNPIPIPIVIDIDNTNYVNSPPIITAPPVLNIEGCTENDITALTARYPFSTIESTDIKDTYVSAGYTVSSDTALTSITYIDAMTPGSSCPLEITRTFTATNSCGYTGTAIQIINVVDTISPTIDTSAINNTVECDGAGNISALNTWVNSNGGAIASDNCSAVIWSHIVDSVVNVCGSTNVLTYTFTATDACGNESTTTATFTIEDTTAPILPSAPADTTYECITDIPTAVNLTATDNCAGDIIATGIDSIDNSDPCNIVITRTWTFTDSCNNSSSVSQLITINPSTAPVVPADGSSTVDCIADAIQPAAPVVTDICGNDIIPVITQTTNPLCSGTKIYTFTYTDCAGNTTDWSYTYTIDVPDFTPAADAGSTVNCLADAQIAPTAPAVNDACGNPITPVLKTTPADIACSGNMIWVYTYTDCEGNSHDWSYTYTIDVPDFILPVNGLETVDNLADAVEPTPPTVTDSCGNPITPTLTDMSSTPACQGSIVYTFNYTDCEGNSHDWTYTYTIVLAPFTVPADGSSTVNCLADAQVTPAAPTVLDANGNVITPVVTTTPADIPCSGDMTWVFTYTDCAGNTANWSYTYTIDVPDFTPAADAGSTVNCLADAQVAPTAPAVNDACGNPITPVLKTTPADIACSGDMIWVYTYTDCEGNSHDWSYTYTIDVPDFILPVNGLETVDNLADAVEPTPPTVTDSCGNPITPTLTDVSSTPACQGSIVYTFNYTDCEGNSHDWTYTYTIVLAPFTVPADESSNVACIADAIVPTPPTVFDANGNEVVPVMTENADPVCVGDKIYTFTYTDCADNTADWIYTYNVKDDVTPVAPSAPANITFECIDDVPVAGNLTAVDNCSGNITVAGVDSYDNSNPCNVIITRTWTFTDNCGNSSAVAQVITVTDKTAPVAPNAPANITFECIDNVPVAGNLTAVDNCAGNITVGGVDTVDNSNPCNVIITRTWTFTDDCGNTSSVVQTITVIDTTAPELTSDLDTDLTVSCANVPEIPNLKFTDNCSSNVDVVFDETNSFDEALLNDYEIIRTWTVSDACGNKNTYTQTLYVTLDEVVTEITADDKCYDDGIVDLNDYLQTTNLTGVWEMLEGNTDATLEGNIFNPTLLELSLDFKPGTGGIDYLFKYTTTDFGCISVTYVTMNINAECTVLPCGSEDVVISKAITPNGDQWNENFEINGVELCGFVMDVKIFNRWGALVFESHNYQNDWNGKSMSGSIGSAEKLPNGTYYYIIILKDSGLNPFTGPVYIGTK